MRLALGARNRLVDRIHTGLCLLDHGPEGCCEWLVDRRGVFDISAEKILWGFATMNVTATNPILVAKVRTVGLKLFLQIPQRSFFVECMRFGQRDVPMKANVNVVLSLAAGLLDRNGNVTLLAIRCPRNCFERLAL